MHKIESVIKTIKDFAKNNAALFTKICSLIFAFVVFYPKLCYFAYNYGKIARFNIDIHTVKLVSDSDIYSIVFYIIVSIVVLIMNYIGYYCYKKNSLLIYFVCLLPISLIISIFSFHETAHIDLNELFHNIWYCAVVFITAISIIFISNSMIILVAISPSLDESFCRLQNKLEKIDGKYRKNADKHVKFRTFKTQKLLKKSQKLLLKQDLNSNKQETDKNKSINCESPQEERKQPNCNELIKNNISEIQKNIKIYKDESAKKETQYNPYRITDHRKLGVIIVAFFALIIIGFATVGRFQESSIKKIGIVENTTYFSEEATNAAVIYQNDEYMILLPCYIKDDVMHVNTSYQYRTVVGNANTHFVSIQSLEVESQDKLDEYYGALRK